MDGSLTYFFLRTQSPGQDVLFLKRKAKPPKPKLTAKQGQSQIISCFRTTNGHVNSFTVAGIIKKPYSIDFNGAVSVAE